MLILEINNRGILVSKEFNNIDNMNDIKISKNETEKVYGKRDFIYKFLSSLRQKINDPLGKRRK